MGASIFTLHRFDVRLDKSHDNECSPRMLKNRLGDATAQTEISLVCEPKVLRFLGLLQASQ